MLVTVDKGMLKHLHRELFAHKVETAQERGWDTSSDCDLLDRAEETGFEALVTTDQGTRYQQNMTNRRVAVVVLMNTTWPCISKRTEAVLQELDGNQPSEVREVPILTQDET